MANAGRLLLRDDPKAFMAAVMNDSADKRYDLLKSNFDDIILCEIIRYGIFSDSAMIGPLAQLYNETVLPNYLEDQRWELYKHIKDTVENVRFVSVNSLLPFIAEDDSRRIVSTAVVDYVSVGPLTANDPMSRPKDIIGMIEAKLLKNEGAAFGGLLHLGDPRLCKLLWPLRHQLDAAAVGEAINCSTGFLYSACVDFEIKWLEEMEGDSRDGLFGHVAAGIALQKRMNRYDVVVTGERPFPFPKISSPKDQERLREMGNPISIDEYTKRIAPRLYALERTEPPPRVMPRVLMEWGLKPLSEPSEIAEMDDRAKSPTISEPMLQESIPDGQIIEQKGEWFDGQGTIFAAWGILNPNGPTLYCLGEKQVNGKRRVFLRWLHMLGGRTTYASKSDPTRLTYQNIFDEAVAIHNYLIESEQPGLMMVIPSFVIVNGNDNTLTEIIKDLLLNGPGARADWGKELSYVRAFGVDLFGRAGCEIRAYYESEKAKAIAAGKPIPDLSSLHRASLWAPPGVLRRRDANVRTFRIKPRPSRGMVVNNQDTEVHSSRIQHARGDVGRREFGIT
jgi:hypothetical protein